MVFFLLCKSHLFQFNILLNISLYAFVFFSISIKRIVSNRFYYFFPNLMKRISSKFFIDAIVFDSICIFFFFTIVTSKNSIITHSVLTSKHTIKRVLFGIHLRIRKSVFDPKFHTFFVSNANLSLNIDNWNRIQIHTNY